MGNIHQEIWDADQGHNGIKAVKKGDTIDPATKAHVPQPERSQLADVLS